MNTADRSIALVDAALRRRFHFVPFYPDEPPVKGLLRRWLNANKLDHLWWVADVVDKANELLPSRDLAIGPSYFISMKDSLNDKWVSLIWKHSIIPYVREQLFGQPESAIEDYYLETLKAAVLHSETDVDEGE